MDGTMAAKKCTKCGEEKPLSEFYKRADAKDGLSHWCKPCIDAQRRANAALNVERERESRRRWAKANPEKVRASGAKKRSNPEYKIYIQEYGKAYYNKNKERLKAVRRDWYLENKSSHNARTLAAYYAEQEKWAAVNKEWARQNREKMRAYTAVSDAKRRAAKAKSSWRYTAKDIENIFSLQRGRCAACREKLGPSFHRDHIKPLATGGSNDRHNIQLLCRSCNSKKHKKDPVRFMQERGYLL
jgi:5-methylcytosine-specific restriction endonuclease McrA